LPTEPNISLPVDEAASTQATPAPIETMVQDKDTSHKHSLTVREFSWRGAALAVAIGITIGLFLVIDQEQIRRFQQYGYFGVFLISLIGNASIALPIPSLFFTFVAATTFNWVIVGLVAGIGEALGESTGYLAGYGGSAIIEDRGLYDRMQYWMEKYGVLTIFILSMIPNPIIDLAGIAAGASRFGYIKFLVTCWLGKTIKTLGFAWAGAHSIVWVMKFLG
jgi:uncharacterized membrane protein YdjX (TVP38/TMEM64 family)